MKLTLKTLKPRNPLVMPSRQRLAGAHRPGTGARRRQAERALRHELEQLRHSP